MTSPFSVSGSPKPYLSLVAAKIAARGASWGDPALVVEVTDADGRVLFSYQNGRCWAVTL